MLHNDPKEAQLWECDSTLGRVQDSWPELIWPWLNARSPKWKSVCTQNLQWQEYKHRPLSRKKPLSRPKGDACISRKRLQVQVESNQDERRFACKWKNVKKWGRTRRSKMVGYTGQNQKGACSLLQALIRASSPALSRGCVSLVEFNCLVFTLLKLFEFLYSRVICPHKTSLELVWPRWYSTLKCLPPNQFMTWKNLEATAHGTWSVDSI